jgi:hypothetical protein
MEVIAMDLDHALRVFKLYYYLFAQDPSQAEGMLLTEGEKQAIADVEKVVIEYSALVANKAGSAAARA